jgi:chitinase
LLVVVLCAAAVGWTGTRAVSALVTRPAVPGPSVFAGYVDVTATPSYPFETPAGPAQSVVILSFVVAGPGAGCTPTWGGYYTLDEASSKLELDRRISQLRLTGGQARVSFGGQRGTDLASACTDPQALRAAYQSVIDRYQLTHIDLDLEGASLADPTAAIRRTAAIKELQDAAKADGRNLAVSLTLPVGPTGLTDAGRSVVAGMLSAGVDLAGVNGMTMDFGVVTSEAAPLSAVVIRAATALQGQVSRAYADAGRPISDGLAWAKVGVTPMIGQSDVPTEVFTLADAAVVNQFARENGVGLVSMWSLNRDATCGPPLPSILTVVQTICSGVNQAGQRFANVLAADLGPVLDTPTFSTTSPSASRTQEPTVAPTDLVDDPSTSPFPIWDPLGTYPSGTKIVWHHQVYQARFWTSGFAPDTPVANAMDSPWTLIGPVLPGDTPAPLPTLPAGSYPQWNAAEAYVAGSRVQVGLVPYEAKWWTQATKPGESVAGGSPWVLVNPGG